MNWEDRFGNLFENIASRLTSSDSMVLGTLSYVANRLSIPTWGVRIVILALAVFWPIWTALGYLVASYFIDRDDTHIE